MISIGERGSVLLETVTATATLVLLITGGLSISYMAFARVWLERSAYEAVICLATSASIETCRTELQDATDAALPLGKIADLRLRRTRRTADVSFSFELFGREVIRTQDRRPLPLPVKASI